MNKKKLVVFGTPFAALMLIGFLFGDMTATDSPEKRIASHLIAEELGTDDFGINPFKAQVNSSRVPLFEWLGCTDSDGGKNPLASGMLTVHYTIDGSEQRTANISDQNYTHQSKDGIIEFYCVNANRPKANFVECEITEAGVCKEIKAAKISIDMQVATATGEFTKVLDVSPQGSYLDVYTDISFQLKVTNTGNIAGDTILTETITKPESGGTIGEAKNVDIDCPAEAICQDSSDGNSFLSISNLLPGQTATAKYLRDVSAFGTMPGAVSEFTDTVRSSSGANDSIVIRVHASKNAETDDPSVTADINSELNEILNDLSEGVAGAEPNETTGTENNGEESTTSTETDAKNLLTRALLVEELVDALYPEEKNNLATLYSQQSFSDVPPTHPNFSSIEIAHGLNIITGYEDGSFKPESSITRAGALKVLLLAADIPTVKTELPFKDVSDEAWYYEYVSSAYHNGIIPEEGDTFSPDDPVEYGRFMEWLDKAFDQTSSESDPESPYQSDTATLDEMEIGQ